MRNRVLRAVQRPVGVWHVSVFYQFSGGVGPIACGTDSNGNVYVARQDFASSHSLVAAALLLLRSTYFLMKIRMREVTYRF